MVITVCGRWGLRVAFLAVDDGFDEHTKIENLSDRAFRLHVAGLCHCARNLTDGFVSERAFRGFSARLKATKRHKDELIRAGLWREYGPDFVIHDYLDHNPTAADVKERKRLRQEAGRLGGLRSGEARAQASASANAPALLKQAVEPHPLPSPKDQVLFEGRAVENLVDNSLRSVTG